MITVPATAYKTELDRLFDRIRNHLEETGMSQRELGRKAGVRHATVSEMLSTEYDHSPRWDTLSRLAEACGFELRFDLQEKRQR